LPQFLLLLPAQIALTTKLNIKFCSAYVIFLLEKPPVVQQLKNFPAFYGTRRFIIVVTGALHSSLSSAKSIQSIHPLLFL
jgi:hypothetical protein